MSRFILSVSALIALLASGLIALSLWLASGLPGAELIYISQQGTQRDLHLLDVRTGITVRLTREAGQFNRPLWSPDGRQVLVASNHEGPEQLYLLDVVQRALQPVTGSPAHPGAVAWSPDGQHLALTLNRPNGVPDLFMLSLASGELQALTTTSGVIEQHPAWSPDSQSLIYSASGLPSMSQLYQRNLGEAQPRLLVRQARQAAWSPDGRWLAYSDERARLALLDLTTHTKRSTGIVLATYQEPHWTPDSERLLLLSEAGAVLIYDIASEDLHRLTDTSLMAVGAAWSPDARFIALAGFTGEKPALFILDVASRQLRRLDVPLPLMIAPQWRPTGT